MVLKFDKALKLHTAYATLSINMKWPLIKLRSEHKLYLNELLIHVIFNYLYHEYREPHESRELLGKKEFMKLKVLTS